MSETAAMAVPISAWHNDHVTFNELLGRLRAELDVFHRGERPDYEGMSEMLTYLRDYGDAVHHPREGVAFARLAKRCPDMALALARLDQEHRVIAQAGQKLLEQIEAVLGGAFLPRGEVETSLATYLVYYGNHIAKEEEDVLTRAAKHLTAEDWAAVRAAPGS
ncbi:MAG TPA: hemerythrin domain-containing protein [Burkholderiales bacterium]|nr:hemerythrin domain-containing protein [Burkholderiales bacterium]